jgi:hypothetical protein
MVSDLVIWISFVTRHSSFFVTGHFTLTFLRR